MSDIDWKARAEAAEKRAAQWEHDIKFWGIAEIAVRNVSVMDYMKHWEARAEAAEKLLWRCYLGIAVLKTMCRKVGLTGGTETADELLHDIAEAYPHFPAKTALRGDLEAKP